SRSDFYFFQAEDGIRDRNVTGVQTCALPILCRRTAVTEESTPPLIAHNTLRSPTCSRIFSTSMSMKFSIVHSPVHPEISLMKFFKNASPWMECLDSGWNCTP